MSQRDETAEKISELKAQLGSDGGMSGLLDSGTDDTAESDTAEDESDAPDTTTSGSADLPEIGESVGRTLGGLIGRRLGEAIGREFELDERMVTMAMSYLDTMEDGEGIERLVGSSADETDEETEADTDSSELSDDFDELSTQELQSLADQLMDELEARSEDG
ncbi:hypothetical protein [Halococcus saccharolyticus]|uniref:Uncharacterized protein n=1 Tax=Halococcus saccharolyticus DSM 5350 TaxID=1227455 RepID=M0MLI1_9EURY|nr:hypothetical protein [Halococcus saccharolyticus]EMA46537.1 hypothetical protein C449_04290 [Halococcus saccharolyticus DSM 5350]